MPATRRCESAARRRASEIQGIGAYAAPGVGAQGGDGSAELVGGVDQGPADGRGQVGGQSLFGQTQRLLRRGRPRVGLDGDLTERPAGAKLRGRPDLGEEPGDVRRGQLSLGRVEEALAGRVELVRAEIRTGASAVPRPRPWPPRCPGPLGPGRPALGRRCSDRAPGRRRSIRGSGATTASRRTSSQCRSGSSRRPSGSSCPSAQPRSRSASSWQRTSSRKAVSCRSEPGSAVASRRPARSRTRAESGRALRHRAVRPGQLVGGKLEH